MQYQNEPMGIYIIKNLQYLSCQQYNQLPSGFPWISTMANIPMQFWSTTRLYPTTKLHGMLRSLLGLMMPQLTFWISPASEAIDGLESQDIGCFGQYHNIPMLFSFAMEHVG